MNTPALNHLNLLGYRARDKVTAAEGVVESISFDLYGCVQASLNCGIKEDGERKPSYWFDISRLERISDERVMDPPDFQAGDIADGKHGPADKPTGRG